MQEHAPQSTNEELIADMQAQLKEHANWQQRVTTTQLEVGLESGAPDATSAVDLKSNKPSERGIAAEDIAYNAWLSENASDDHRGPSLRELIKADAADKVAAERRERLREMARLSMRVKTGVATGEEAAYYYTMQEKAEEEAAEKAAATEAARSKVAEATQPAPKTVESESTESATEEPQPETKPATKPAAKQQPKASAEPAVKTTAKTADSKANEDTTPSAPKTKLRTKARNAAAKTKRGTASLVGRTKETPAKAKTSQRRQKSGYGRLLADGARLTKAYSKDLLARYKHSKQAAEQNDRPLSLFEDDSAETDASNEFKFSYDYHQSPASYHEIEGDEHDSFNEDSLLVDAPNQLFGVFDGAGGAGGNPRAASRAAAAAFEEYFNKISVKELLAHDDLDPEIAKQVMRVGFTFAREAVDEEGEDAVTTAAVVKMVTINGQPHALIGNAGDSRILIGPNERNNFKEGIHDADTKPDALYEVVTDQSSGNTVFNALGQQEKGTKDEFTLVALKPGDRMIICSDGITGDYPEQFLRDQDWRDIFKAPTIEEATDLLFARSKKDDDKTAVVIDVPAVA